MPIICKKVETIPEFIDAVRLRVDVFIIEQGFKPGWEPDKDDKQATHFIALDKEIVVATARIRETTKNEFKIERMTVVKEYRKKGVGKDLLVYVLNYLRARAPKKIWLRSQERSKGFYEKCGFKLVGEPFDMHGIPHVDMEYKN